MEEQWTEILAFSAVGVAPVYLALAGFYFGPVFTPPAYRAKNYVDLNQSLIGAGIGFAVGLIIAGVALALRIRAIKTEHYMAPDESIDDFTGEYIEGHHH